MVGDFDHYQLVVPDNSVVMVEAFDCIGRLAYTSSNNYSQLIHGFSDQSITTYLNMNHEIAVI